MFTASQRFLFWMSVVYLGAFSVRSQDTIRFKYPKEYAFIDADKNGVISANERDNAISYILDHYDVFNKDILKGLGAFLNGTDSSYFKQRVADEVTARSSVTNPNELNTDGLKSIDLPLDYRTEPIATDRPDQTESPFLVPKGMFQAELGTSFEKDKDDSLHLTNATYGTALWKYGLSRHIELRLITEYLGTELQDVKNDRVLDNTKGLSSILVGGKFFICEERGIIPKTSLIAHLNLPYFGERAFSPNVICPEFRFTLQHTLSDRFSFSYNIGAEWDGIVSNTTFIYTATLGMGLFEKVGMYVEAYGFMTEQNDVSGRFNGAFTHDHRLDAGFTYQPVNDVQFDVSGGIGINDISPDYFLSAGISFRLLNARK